MNKPNPREFQALNDAVQAGIPPIPIAVEASKTVAISDTAPNFEAVNKFTFVKPDQKYERKQGQIVIAGDNDKKVSTGLVLSTGSPLCKAGDRVVYAAIRAFVVDGEERFVVHEDALIGVQRAKA